MSERNQFHLMRENVISRLSGISALGGFKLYDQGKKQEPILQCIQRVQHWEHHNEFDHQTLSRL